MRIHINRILAVTDYESLNVIIEEVLISVLKSKGTRQTMKIPTWNGCEPGAHTEVRQGARIKRVSSICIQHPSQFDILNKNLKNQSFKIVLSF